MVRKIAMGLKQTEIYELVLTLTVRILSKFTSVFIKKKYNKKVTNDRVAINKTSSNKNTADSLTHRSCK